LLLFLFSSEKHVTWVELKDFHRFVQEKKLKKSRFLPLGEPGAAQERRRRGSRQPAAPGAWQRRPCPRATVMGPGEPDDCQLLSVKSAVKDPRINNFVRCVRDSQ
jgi:hypothetical protein